MSPNTTSAEAVLPANKLAPLMTHVRQIASWIRRSFESDRARVALSARLVAHDVITTPLGVGHMEAADAPGFVGERIDDRHAAGYRLSMDGGALDRQRHRS